MAEPLTRELSYALCTVIAAGFIYENNTKASGLKTKFVYELEAAKPGETPEQREKREAKNEQVIGDHTHISNLLFPYKIDVSFENQTPKHTNTLIAAQTKYVFGKEQTHGLVDECSRACQIIETKLNRIKDSSLPGAYIGGILKQNKLEFTGPSYLYLYDAFFRGEPPYENAEKFYNAAKEASGKLIDFIKENKGSITSTEWSILFTNEPPAIQDYDPTKMFASCHGMIMSMFRYPNIPKTDIWIELALGNDTSKVASCLPCSMFMYANNSPATATHLGRGDNWNFPDNIPTTSRTMIPPWEEDVIRFYDIGIEKLGKSMIANAKVRELMEWVSANVRRAKIPWAFLEALTFEGPFTEKIISTIG